MSRSCNRCGCSNPSSSEGHSSGEHLNLKKYILLIVFDFRGEYTYALLMGGASLEVIMDQFKHSSMKTTMSYIDSIDNEKRKDIAKLL